MPRKYSLPADVDVMTTQLYIPEVIGRKDCSRHKADIGQPCFDLQSENETGYFGGICNSRAKRAGMRGPISSYALRLTSPRSPRASRG